jgi:hypothetical protein
MRFLLLLSVFCAGCTVVYAPARTGCGSDLKWEITVDRPVKIDALGGNNVSPSGNTVPLSGL